MSVFKCKMCGGTIEFEQGATVGVCDSCGTKQTLPLAADEAMNGLHNRANTLRLKCEFDKAEEIYNKILENHPDDAEAHWGIILCKYGIEYVEDPKTFNRIPTCHRTSFEAILADEDYKAAVANGDMAQRELYEAEAREIDRIQKDILAVVKNEKPFDVFVCYKETDANGKRTQDSVIANDIYYQLTQEGFKVFYAAITLEDKLGQEYEPYIFAALNSAKVMLVIGTKPEYFTAVWVKNEWSRYLKLMKTDRAKLLIPCYRDMDAYELPEEFAHLQAQDMGKIGFINDIVRGIKKVVSVPEQKQEKKPEPETRENVFTGGAGAAPLLKRARISLEDGEWDKTDQFCEQALNLDPENAEAYFVKLMAELHVRNEEDLKNRETPFDGRGNYQKALRFADPAFAETLKGYIAFINERNENARLTELYEKAKSMMQNAKSEDAYKKAAEMFKNISGFKDAEKMAAECLEESKNVRLKWIYELAVNTMNAAETEIEYQNAAEAFASIPGFKDADALAEKCIDKSEDCRKNRTYEYARSLMDTEETSALEKAIGIFQSLSDWQDCEKIIGVCRKKIEEIEKKKEERRIAAEKAKKKTIKIAKIVTPIVAACLAVVILLTTVIIPSGKYNSAMELYNAGNYQDAYTAFNEVSYKDSKDKASECLFLVQKPNLSGIKKGDTVKFGFYEQDNNTTNGKEEIEWIVLNVEDNKALVISKYALDCQQYNTSYTDVTWEKCTLRKWLNDSFLNTAFGSKHQEQISSVSVSADKNPKYSTNPGNATTDKVFLLSITEAEKYFSSDSARQCSATAYVKAQGAYTSTSNGNCWWWLRSPGYSQNLAAYVNYDGSVNYNGLYVGSDLGAVRPALWINLK